jgi:hypothetical protein
MECHADGDDVRRQKHRDVVPEQRPCRRVRQAVRQAKRDRLPGAVRVDQEPERVAGVHVNRVRRRRDEAVPAGGRTTGKRLDEDAVQCRAVGDQDAEVRGTARGRRRDRAHRADRRDGVDTVHSAKRRGELVGRRAGSHEQGPWPGRRHDPRLAVGRADERGEERVRDGRDEDREHRPRHETARRARLEDDAPGRDQGADVSRDADEQPRGEPGEPRRHRRHPE